MLSGYLLAGLLEPESTRFIVESYFVSLSVMVMIGLLLGPKFRPILSGTIYNPDSLQYDSISFSAALTKEDMRRMRKYLRRFGYRVYKRGEGVDEGKEFESITESRLQRQSSIISRVGRLSRLSERSFIGSFNALFRSDSHNQIEKACDAADVALCMDD